MGLLQACAVATADLTFFFFQTTPALILSNDPTLFVYGLLVPADEGANTEFKSEVVGRNKKNA